MSDRPELTPDPPAGQGDDHGGGGGISDLGMIRPQPGQEVVDAALRLVTTLVAATIGNADGVSVTLERQGQLTTVAASDDKVLRMDGHQYATGEGPCLSAKAEGRAFYIGSLAAETRWPAFTPLALEQGIHSILSSPLLAAQRPLGALNIYSNALHAFDDRDQNLAELFANQASDVLTRAHADVDEEQLKRRWAAGLAARQTIAQAQGVLMRDRQITATAADVIIRDSARTEQVTVLQYATQLLSPYNDDDPGPGRSVSVDSG